jgi:ABC-2 type transport system ATP-binding protein
VRAPPPRRVGALLEANGFHPDRSGRDHLRTYAAATGVPETRIDQVLDEVGLGQAARQHVRGYSLGMRQRLGIASALLPDPPVLICDEPTNGLDPEGIRWLRALLRERAERGHTVLVSSHLLAEMQQTVDSVVIVDHGRLVYEGPLEAAGGGAAVRVTCVDAPALYAALAAEAFGTGGTGTGSGGGTGRDTGRDTGTGTGRVLIEPAGPGALLVRDVTAEQVGRIALRAGIALTQLVTEADNLEQLFFSLTETATPAPTDLRTGGTHDAALSPTTKEMAQ